MYPQVIQFETRERLLREELRLLLERHSRSARRERSRRGGVLCAILTAAIALAPQGAAGAGSSATFSDAVGDAGDAPDIASVTLTKLDSATLGVTVELASPTTLDRYTWVLIGIDTDRNQRTGGMHGSEAIVFVNGENAVLQRLRGRVVPVDAKLEGTELTFPLPFAQIGARTFDFAVATLRQDADVAPARGVFSFPPASRNVPAKRDVQHWEERSSE
jgi:hypothetical protein